jgi:hypothetical protein
VTVREVAEAMPALLNWWKNELLRKIISKEGNQVTVETIKTKVDNALADLTLHYYVRRNLNNGGVQQAIRDGFLTAPEEEYVTVQEDGLVGPAVQGIRQDLLVGQEFSLGNDSRLRFSNGSNVGEGNVELIYRSADGSNAKANGIWRIDKDELLLQGISTDEVLRLELETDWSSHLSLRLKEDSQAVYARGSFLDRLLEIGGQFRMGS